MAASQYGQDYSLWLNQPASPLDPFPNPVNDAQRMQNARARAKRAGVDIGSGYLNPQSGKLENPDSGFEKWMADHWPLVAGLIVGGPIAGQALFGGGAMMPAVGQAGVIPGTGIPTVGGTGVGLTAPLAATMPAAGASGVIPGTGIPTVGGTGVGITETPGALPNVSRVPLSNVARNPPGVASTAPPAVTATDITRTTTAGTSTLERLRNALTSPNGIAALTSLVSGLSNPGNNSGASSPDLSRLQAITEARMRRADPLHQVAVQLAFQRAPISAKQGVSLQNVPLPQ